MYIKSLSVKNFKAFNNNVVLDLAVKHNLATEDIERRRFYKYNEIALPRVVSITGANSIGKTALLDAIKIYGSIIGTFYPENELIWKKSRSNSKQNVTSNLDSQKEFNDYIKSVNAICEVNENRKDYVSINNYKEYNYKKLLEEASMLYSERYEDSEFQLNEADLKDLFEESASLINTRWINNKHIKYEESEIKIELFDEQTKELIDVIINDNEKTLKYFVNAKKDDIAQKAIKYLENILYIPQSLNIRPREYELMIVQIIKNLKKILKFKTINEAKDEFVKFIRVLDPSIKDINLSIENNLKDGIKDIILRTNAKVSVNDLSSGTKRFIQIIDGIISKIKTKQSFAILIDEIDNLLHNDLITFLKNLAFFSRTPIQLIFTSHNYDVASDELNNKQIFSIQYDENDDKVINKLSNSINTTKKAAIAFKEKLVGSHPFSIDIDHMMERLMIDDKK